MDLDLDSFDNAAGAPALYRGARLFSVLELTRAIRGILESSFPRVAVRGEITNLSRPQSGHVYFSLVDDAAPRLASRLSSAQLACVLWRSSAGRLRLELENGLKVVVSGRLGVYEPRGTYQLIADRVEHIGAGDLQRRFEVLKETLRREGLFAPERKRPLPFLPERIGIITSPGGAAIQDVLRVLYRRHPRAWVRVVPVRVQGEGAAEQMVQALKVLASGGGQADVIVLTRGGGSLEDLWAFNEERLARALAASPVPTVSAVGHEVDFTIADFVADVRAQTPTKAGEILVPDVADLQDRLDGLLRRLRLAVRAPVARREAALERLLRSRFIRRPAALPEEMAQRCDYLGRDLKIQLYNRLGRWEDALVSLSRRLEGLNPRRVLERGYSLTTDDQGRVVTRSGDLQVGAGICVEFARGAVRARVTQREPHERERRDGGERETEGSSS